MKRSTRLSAIALASITWCNLVASPAYSQATAQDQYKQMGGLAALAQSCYGSKAIPNKLDALARESFAKNPEVKDPLNALLAEYNAAYLKAGVDHRIWNGTQQQFGERVYRCASAEDIADIKKFENLILQSMGVGVS